jgi:HSP20 family protein
MSETRVQEQQQAAVEQRQPETEQAPRRVYSPRTDIYETRDAVVVVSDMPGVDEKSVDISVENDTLTISGKVESQAVPGHRLVWQEYGEGDYRRAFTLSNDVDRDNITAVVKNGVLRLTLPKGGPAKARKIEVKAQA